MRYAALVVLPLLQGACAPERNDSAADVESLVRAERAFANASVTSTTRSAFLANLGADAVLFDNGPTNGLALWEARPAVGGVLSWEPEFADVAASGDMGYTFGAWELRTHPDSAAVGWGHFISVWRKDSAGNWKVAADGGVSHGPVELPGDSPVERASDGTDWADPCDTSEVAIHQSSLDEADDRYSRTVAESGVAAAIEQLVDPSARFFRNGSLPLIGIDAISTSTYVTEAEWDEWEARNAAVSASCDLGYSYGVVDLRPSSASYYRIWRRSDSAGWKVVIDVLIPFRPTAE